MWLWRLRIPNMPRIMDWIPKHAQNNGWLNGDPMAQSSWQIKLTITRCFWDFSHSGLNISQSYLFFSFVLFSTSKQFMLILRWFYPGYMHSCPPHGFPTQASGDVFLQNSLLFHPLSKISSCVSCLEFYSSLSHLSRIAVLSLDASPLRHVGKLSLENQGSHNPFFREHTLLLSFVLCQETLNLNVLFCFLFFTVGEPVSASAFS